VAPEDAHGTQDCREEQHDQLVSQVQQRFACAVPAVLDVAVTVGLVDAGADGGGGQGHHLSYRSEATGDLSLFEEARSSYALLPGEREVCMSTATVGFRARRTVRRAKRRLKKAVPWVAVILVAASVVFLVASRGG
jgi:hypothetical protein